MYGDEDDGCYSVVVNQEQQYSLWPADRTPPAGWEIVPIDPAWQARHRADHGAPPGGGNKAECLAYIESVWTDMRPRSLREAMARGE